MRIEKRSCDAVIPRVYALLCKHGSWYEKWPEARFRAVRRTLVKAAGPCRALCGGVNADSERFAGPYRTLQDPCKCFFISREQEEVII
jgi:hypothetical protein